MPKRSSTSPHQGQQDVNEIAFNVVQQALGEIPTKEEKEKNPAAVELGRMGGKVGGRARANSLTSDARSEIARRAAVARWRAKNGEN